MNSGLVLGLYRPVGVLGRDCVAAFGEGLAVKGEFDRVEEEADELDGSLTRSDAGIRDFVGLLTFEVSELVGDRDEGFGCRGRRMTLGFRGEVSLCDRL